MGNKNIIERLSQALEFAQMVTATNPTQKEQDITELYEFRLNEQDGEELKLLGSNTIKRESGESIDFDKIQGLRTLGILTYKLSKYAYNNLYTRDREQLSYLIDLETDNKYII